MIEDTTTFQTGIDFAPPSSSSGLRRSSSHASQHPQRSLDGTIAFETVFTRDGDIAMPNGVNFVALRETFLSEAPFIKRANRQFWKKWIDSRQFGNVFAGSLRLVTESVLDNGSIDAKKLFVLPSKLSQMAMQTRFLDLDAEMAAQHAKRPHSQSHSNLHTHTHSHTETHPRPHSSHTPSPHALLNTHKFGEADPYGFTSTSKHHVAGTGDDLARYQARLLEKISLNVAEMMMIDRHGGATSRSHDLLLNRLPELLCFMIVNACVYALPKLTRVFNAIRFRELVMDFLNELLGGIRITNCQMGREWLFKDASDTNILVLDPPNHLCTSFREFSHISPYALAKKNAGSTTSLLSTTLSKKNTALPSVMRDPARPRTVHSKNVTIAHEEKQKEEEEEDNEEQRLNAWRRSHCSGARSSFVLNNSPIIGMYLNSTRGPHEKPFVSKHGAKLSLTHFPDRPVVSMQPLNVQSEGKFRDKIMDSETLDAAIRSAAEKRKQILAEKQKNYSSMAEDFQMMCSLHRWTHFHLCR